ncbi:MAG: MOSC domain-containing protein [Comamonadaceae bacterium]|nr:MAG: MOSC domain-containing protein [Comamonadaceae bacterium]
MTFRTDHDLAGTIARLFIHPVKSCAGIEVQEALLTESGLDLDRAWMVVDAGGVFLSQRALPRMALIRPQLKSQELVLRAPGMLALHLSLDRVDGPATVQVWDDTVPAWDMGGLAAQWFSDFLGQPCRLVRFDPEFRRLSSLQWTGGVEAPNQFSDGFPVLVTSLASIEGLNERLLAVGQAAVGVERFRPNVVIGGVEAHDEDRIDTLYIGTQEGEVHLRHVKPCARCPIPDIDPATADSTPAVGDTLRTYRQDRRLDGAISFGMNAIAVQGAGRVLRVGQPIAADLRFD